MNKVKNVLSAAEDVVTEAGARMLVAATNVTGKMMTTQTGRMALVLPMALSACTVTASAQNVDAQGMLDSIMKVLKPGVAALGALVAVVGGIQLGVGFKDDNADGKTRGFQTLVGGAIIAAVSAAIPENIKLTS